MRRTTGAMTLAVAATLAIQVSLTAGPPAFAAPPTSPAGEITLPALYGTNLPRDSYIRSTASGAAWLLDETDARDGTAYFSNYNGMHHVDSGLGNSRDLQLGGSELIGAVNGQIRAIDITTGAPMAVSCQSDVLASTGDGCLSRANISHTDSFPLYLSNSSTNETTQFEAPPIDGESAPEDSVGVLAADEAGAVISAEGNRVTSPGSAPKVAAALEYLDFSTGDYTLLDRSLAAGNANVAMDGSVIIWTRAGHIEYVERDDLVAAPTTVPGVVHATAVAINNGNLAFVATLPPSYSDDTRMAFSGPLTGSSFTEVTGDAAPEMVVWPADDGDFAVLTGDTVDTRGLYRLHPGAAALSGVIALFGPSSPLGIEASAGRIVSVVADNPRHPALERKITAVGNSLSAAKRADVLAAKLTNTDVPDTSGDTSAYLFRNDDGTFADVQDGTEVVASFPVPSGAYDVEVSGRWLVVPYRANLFTPNSGAVAIDLDDGSRMSVPETSALYGDVIYFFKSGSGVWSRNLDTGAEARVAGLTSCDGDPTGTVLEAAGSWVMCGPGGPVGATTTAVNLTTGEVVDVPIQPGAPGTIVSASEPLLADGLVAWIDPTDRSVHLFNLDTTTDTIVGTSHSHRSGRRYLALTDEFVAWVASDDTTRVVPLGSSADSAPRYLGGAATSTFSSAIAGRRGDYTPALNVTRPLTAWALTIRNSAGAVVRRLHGSAADGGVRPSWNGKTSSGIRLTHGVFHWTLTGRGRSGALIKANGSHAAITGRVRIDTVAPHAHVRAGARRKDGHRLEIPVTWGCSEAHCRFVVTVQIRRPGSARWSTARRWLTTHATTAVYGAGHVPFAVHPQDHYRFDVTAYDAAGNRSHVVTTASGH